MLLKNESKLCITSTQTGKNSHTIYRFQDPKTPWMKGKKKTKLVLGFMKIYGQGKSRAILRF
jgi:hypothetical protein